MVGFIGWFAGTALRNLWPYLRVGMEKVAEENKWSAWPPFELRYLMLFLISAAELGIALLIFDGFYGTVIGWPLATAALAGYAGTAIANDGLKIINAGIRKARG